jgi:competence protein ComEC
MKRIVLATVLVSTLAGGWLAAQTRAPRTLDIYLIDTEGGKMALYVTPGGQNILIDAGSPGGRDTGRLMEVAGAIGVKKIDYLISTHYHVDHVGGVMELVRRIPVDAFIDHGPTVETPITIPIFHASYPGIFAKGRHIVVKPGDRMPLAGVDWRFVTSAGKAITTSVLGGGQANRYCADLKPATNVPIDPEHVQSVGSVVSFGQFRLVDLSDLSWNEERALMCPTNHIGKIDVYMVSQHGMDPSGSKALVHALAPRVAVMQNGARVGGSTQTWNTLQSSPGFQDLWQLHWSYNGLIDRNPAGVFIANVETMETTAAALTASSRGRGAAGGATTATSPGGSAPAANSATATPAPPGGQVPSATPTAGTPRNAPLHTPAFYIKISARTDGTFTVTNSRNGFSKTYAK